MKTAPDVVDTQIEPRSGEAVMPEGPLLRALRVTTVALTVSAGLMAIFLLALAVSDILWREFAAQGYSFTVALTEVILVAVVFAGMASAQASGSHVSTPVLTARLSRRVAMIVRMTALGIAILFVAWLTFESWKVGLHSYQVKEARFGETRIPLWPAKLMIPIGLAVFTWALGAEAYRKIWYYRNANSSEVGR